MDSATEHDIQVTTDKIRAIKVELTRAEGPINECGRSHTWHGEACIERGDERLRQWAATAPNRGGYDKCDFKVTWSDGSEYEGRFDLERQHTSASWLLGEHMVSFQKYMAGEIRPAHATPDRWRAHMREHVEGIYGEQAREWLDTRDLAQLGMLRGSAEVIPAEPEPETETVASTGCPMPGDAVRLKGRCMDAAAGSIGVVNGTVGERCDEYGVCFRQNTFRGSSAGQKYVEPGAPA